MTNLKYPLVITALIALFLTGCKNGPAPGATTPVKMVNVEVQTLQPRNFSSYLRLVGKVEAANDVRLSAENTGRIERYFKERGDTVKRGTLIAKIDESRLQQEHARLEAATKQAWERYKRQKTLWEDDSVGSEIDVLNAKYAYEQSRAANKAVEVQLENTEIRAPFDAIIEDILTEAGEMASPGTPLVRLITADQVKITAGVPARYSGLISTGDKSSAWFDPWPRDTIATEITFIGSSIDPRNRTFPVELVMPNHEREYKVGMIANLRIRSLNRPESIVIGEEFIYQEHGDNVVYIVKTDSAGNLIANEQIVKLGPSFGSEVVVEGGIQAGDQFITVGSAFLDDQMRIKIVGNNRELSSQHTSKILQD